MAFWRLYRIFSAPFSKYDVIRENSNNGRECTDQNGLAEVNSSDCETLCEVARAWHSTYFGKTKKMCREMKAFCLLFSIMNGEHYNLYTIDCEEYSGLG